MKKKIKEVQYSDFDFALELSVLVSGARNMTGCYMVVQHLLYQLTHQAMIASQNFHDFSLPREESKARKEALKNAIVELISAEQDHIKKTKEEFENSQKNSQKQIKSKTVKKNKK